jgi:hypothetical protein
MSYAGMAASVVGGELQGWAAALARQEMYRQYLKEMIRQRGSWNEALGTFNESVKQGGAETAKEQMGAGQANREAQYERVGNVPLSNTESQRSTSGQALDKARGELVGSARAKLGSYGDWDMEQTLRQVDTARKLNQVANFAGGNAQVFPYRMYDAQHSQDTMAMIGQAISALGGGSIDFSQFSKAPQSGGGGGISQEGFDFNPGLSIDPNTGMAINPTVFG